jgi:hypothetical protein
MMLEVLITIYWWDDDDDDDDDSDSDDDSGLPVLYHIYNTRVVTNHFIGDYDDWVLMIMPLVMMLMIGIVGLSDILCNIFTRIIFACLPFSPNLLRPK